MDVLFLSRLQFAIATCFRFLFVPLPLGLSLLVALMQTVLVRTGDEEHRVIRRREVRGVPRLLRGAPCGDERCRALGTTPRATAGGGHTLTLRHLPRRNTSTDTTVTTDSATGIAMNAPSAPRSNR